ncbi:MAG: 50S ribosomal protein P1 [DPANN group archaeon]|nr:50S ribosomal protein P1 [DPANN group archaeon]
MEYVYAALMLHSAKKDVTEDAVTKVLKSAGIDADAGKVKALIASLDGVDIDEAIASAAVAPVAAAVQASGAAEQPKAEKKEEPAPADEGGGLAALFG